MRVISFIKDRDVIKAILKHLGLWLVKTKPVPYLIREPTPKTHAPPARYIRDPFSQLPRNDDHLYPAKRGTTPEMLTFSRKDQEYWAEGTGVPG